MFFWGTRRDDWKKYTSLGITAFILGIIGIAIIWVPFISLPGIVLAILAIIFGAISYWGKLRDIFGLVGFILGLIEAILYNMFAKWFSGIEIDFVNT